MVKFIIELSDEYLKEKSSVDIFKKKLENKSESSALNAFMNSLMLGKLLKDSKENKEITITPDLIKEEKVSEIFDHAITSLTLVTFEIEKETLENSKEEN